MTARITFHGGAGFVTGANFLFEVNPEREGGGKILVDCGLVQGKEFCDKCNFDPFPYNPAKIDIVIVTHGHTDHIGRIPRLVREGFRGAIYSTPPTKDIAAAMFDDALGLMETHKRETGQELLYEKSDIDTALSLWKTIEYHKPLAVGGEVTATLFDAGHILGSAMVAFERGGKKFVITGDLGNTPAPIVKDTEDLSGVNYLLMESVYGDRNHEEVDKRMGMLKGAIERTREQKGVLLIPAFSLQRTQSVLFEINKLVEDGEIEPIDVYLDTPLGIRILGVYRKYSDYFNERIKARMRAGDDPFDFSGLTLTPQTADSRAISSSPNPKIIIAGSGMSHGGRIRAHEIEFLGDKTTTLLFVGYQTVGSLGRRLLEGEKHVNIDKKWVTVRARVQNITGYSAHKERDQLLEFVSKTAESLEKVFVAMGEPRSSLFLAQRLHDFLGVDAVVPEKGDSYAIEL